VLIERHDVDAGDVTNPAVSMVEVVRDPRGAT